MWKSLWGLTWDYLFKGHATSLYIVMLFSGHRFTDAGIDAMGSFLDPFDRGVS